MTSRRAAVLVVAAILVLGGVALLLVQADSFSAWTAPEPARAVAPVASSPGTTAPLAPVLPAAMVQPQAAPPRISPPGIRGRPSAAADVPWEEVPPATRPADLGAGLAGPVMKALDAARDQMDTCFQEEARLLAKGKGPVLDPADPPTGPGVLILQLETHAGGLGISGTELESLGTSTPELAACAGHALRGWNIVAPAATPGRRYRLKYILM